MPKIASIAFILLLCGSAFGQASRIDIPLQTSGPNVPSTPGPLPQALWVANATVTLCAHVQPYTSQTLSNCQATLLTTYIDGAETSSCPSQTPLVQLPGNTCTASTGVAANVGFWYAGGGFDYYVTSSYGTFGPYTGPAGWAGSGCFVNSIADGCTGATTAPAAIGNLLGNPSSGTYAIACSSGTNCVPTATGGGGGATTTVTCSGTNDTTALQAALTTGGRVVVLGNCVMGASSGHLTISSNTDLELGSSTIAYAPASADDLLVNNQFSQTVARTCTMTMTIGSVAVTSSTCNFTQADIENDSVACIGGYAGGLAYGAATMGTDLHTTFANVASSTAAKLSDPPTAVTNPMTCHIYTRDSNIKIHGGTLILEGPSLPLAKAIVEMVTVNNLDIDGLQTANGSLTAPSDSGFYQVYVADATNFKVRNITLNGWIQGQDGIHLLGPLRAGYVGHIRGHSGDDFIPISAADGASYPVGNGYTEERVYGVVDGLLVEDLDGASYALESAVKIFGPTGTPIPMRNIMVRHVIGEPYSCAVGCESGGYTPGFDITFWLYSGTMDNIGGDDFSGALVDDMVINNAVTAGTVKLTNYSLNNYPYEGLSGTAPLIILNDEDPLPALGYGMNIDSLTICGGRGNNDNGTMSSLVLQDDTYNAAHLGYIKHFNFCDFDASGMTGIVSVNYMLFQSKIDDLTLSNIKFGYADSASITRLITLGGQANIGQAHFRNVSLEHTSAGTGSIGILISLAQVSSSIPVVGQITLDDIVDRAPVSTADTILETSGGTLGSYLMTNVTAINIANCFVNAGTFTGPGQQINMNTQGVTNAGTCNPFSLGIPSIVAKVDFTNQTASLSQTVLYTSLLNSERLHVQCSTVQGGTSGSSTVAPLVVWQSGALYSVGSTLTLNTTGESDLGPTFVQPTAGQTVKYGTTYTSVSGGSYNFSCTVFKYQ